MQNGEVALDTLGDFLPLLRSLGEREAVIHDTPYQRRRLSYARLLRLISGFVLQAEAQDLRKGDRVLLWCENSPEWMAVFWGAVFQGLQVIPVDYQRSWRFVERIQAQAGAKLLVSGDQVKPGPAEIPVLPARCLEEAPSERIRAVPLNSSDVVQILFTSGTTGDPRGIVHTHSNICCTLTPLFREIRRYRLWVSLFRPIRLLTLLPMSHVFGQAFSLFIPVLMGGSLVLLERLNLASTIRTIHEERVSVLALVPEMLEGLREEALVRFQLEPSPPRLGQGWSGVLRTWWRYRSVHHWFGVKFWSFVVGGARISEQVESFWRTLGFAVIQGYGLTEAGPLVSLNHPFRTSQGSIGKPLPGIDIRLARDGEILVRGPGVAETALVGGNLESVPSPDGWLHTGDLGRIDESGQIYFKGRKKDVIVTAEGLNIFPADVEKSLKEQPGVIDCVVLAKPTEAGEEVHACLIVESGTDFEKVVGQANQNLEKHQRIRSWSEWMEGSFPRTESTLKVRRAEIARRLWGAEKPAAEPEKQRSRVDQILDRITETDAGRGPETLELSSLERLELLVRLEDRHSVHLDEREFSELTTLSEVRNLVASARGQEESERGNGSAVPRWPQARVWRWIRAVFQDAFFLPLLRQLVSVSVEGLEEIDPLEGSAIFAANHCSHLDTAVLLAALPPSWRRRLAPAMSREHFAAHFQPGYSFRQRWSSRIKYYLACALFAAYPLSSRRGTRESLQFTGELIEAGQCPLIYPEGIRSPDGKLLPFQSGVGLMALRFRAPVVPVRILGTFEAYSVHDRRPRRGQVRIRFGEALDLRRCESAGEASARVEMAVRELG